MRWWGVSSTVRASFYLYNKEEDIQILVQAVQKVRDYFS
ncbi:aminotransferase class V-fold PLP-dependent enzyme [Pasteuria penetrans]|nr:aminotransferase class V-fold PLP-dependent enzyme [Pasteuria penetrans]